MNEARLQPSPADFALAAEEVMAAIRELRERGGLDDVFGRLPDDSPPLPPSDSRSDYGPTEGGEP
jgi:hypothetical protein